MISSSQIRGARGLLGLTQTELVKRAGISFATLQRMESLGTDRSLAGNVTAVQKALEAAGVEFIPENGGGPGVRMARGSKPNDPR